MKTPKPLPDLDRLAHHDPQTLADESLIPIVWMDHQATRRIKLHGCNIPGNPQQYTSTHFNEVLHHLAAEGYRAAILICETPKLKHLACFISFEPLQ